MKAQNFPASPDDTLPERLLRLSQLQEQFPASRSQIYQLIAEGKFPKPYKVGTSSFWRQSDVSNFIGGLRNES